MSSFESILSSMLAAGTDAEVQFPMTILGE